jgi:hypothetical protein
MSLGHQGLLLAVFIFLGILLFLDVGRRVGVRRRLLDSEDAGPGAGALEAAVYGLLALLIAFTFSGAASRFDARRQLVVEEANAIGTAYLRIDLLPPSAQPSLRESFRRYLDARVELYRKLPDVTAARADLPKVAALQAEIWAQAAAACPKAESGSSACVLLLPALNQMIDLTTTRAAAAEIHPPAIIFVMLVALALATALLAGYNLSDGRTRKWLPMLGFAAAIAVTIYVILDVEYPRLGFIRVDAIDRVLVELRATMKQDRRPPLAEP